MLSSLRKYISKNIKLGEGGQILKFFFERCLDQKYAKTLIDDLKNVAIDNDFDVDDMGYIFEDLAFAFHLEQYLNTSEYGMCPILALILKCIVKDPIIVNEICNPIYFLADVYFNLSEDKSQLNVAEWLESDVGGECQEVLDIITDPELSEKQVRKEIDRMADEQIETQLYYVHIKYPETDAGEHYNEFVQAMDLFKAIQVTDDDFVACYLDYANYEGETLFDLNKKDMAQMLDLIKDITDDPISNYSAYNTLFSEFGDAGIRYGLIDMIMRIKKSNKEVLF
ncbi:MAG TPA: hypothetical protein DCM01_05500 [Dielma fastidiosa]|nr:hypothetical protein [Dielma fastidiosa]